LGEIRGEILEKEPQPESTARAPVDIVNIREQITQEVGGCAVDMVKATIAEVKKGHYLPMKYLFEVIGLYPASAVAESPEDNSLAKILLKSLGIDPECIRPETKVSKDELESWPSPTGDAVE
jgi:hypothetical protein